MQDAMTTGTSLEHLKSHCIIKGGAPILPLSPDPIFGQKHGAYLRDGESTTEGPMCK